MGRPPGRDKWPDLTAISKLSDSLRSLADGTKSVEGLKGLPLGNAKRRAPIIGIRSYSK